MISSNPATASEKWHLLLLWGHPVIPQPYRSDDTLSLCRLVQVCQPPDQTKGTQYKETGHYAHVQQHQIWFALKQCFFGFATLHTGNLGYLHQGHYQQYHCQNEHNRNHSSCKLNGRVCSPIPSPEIKQTKEVRIREVVPCFWPFCGLCDLGGCLLLPSEASTTIIHRFGSGSRLVGGGWTFRFPQLRWKLQAPSFIAPGVEPMSEIASHHQAKKLRPAVSMPMIKWMMATIQVPVFTWQQQQRSDTILQTLILSAAVRIGSDRELEFAE